MLPAKGGYLDKASKIQSDVRVRRQGYDPANEDRSIYRSKLFKEVDIIFQAAISRLKPNDQLIPWKLSTKTVVVLIDPNSKGTVIGVEANSRGIPLKILLKTPSILMKDAVISPEVILSAGTFETPAILLRSGIGIFGQPPVGRNLHDHPMVGLACTFQEPVAINTGVITPLEILRYFWNGKSALAQASALTSIAYLRTSLQRLHNFSRPDIQFTFIAAAVFEQEIFRTVGCSRA
ncbi:hypothetical protein AHF37_06556 [Paragonimus kellicotti]|nr:hypothetical protein AHF37_06556 [Paragonimus kellicotti]